MLSSISPSGAPTNARAPEEAGTNATEGVSILSGVRVFGATGFGIMILIIVVEIVGKKLDYGFK
jgi:hypothetical protein